MRIPYGLSDFATIRRDGFFYVDKTPFLPVLENPMSGYHYLLFLRPRRFGKSTILSMLSHYYDAAKADQFDELFRGLWIYDHPTPGRNKYLVLKLDFSPVETTGDIDDVQESFVATLKHSVQIFLATYRDKFPDFAHLAEKLDDYRHPSIMIGAVLAAVAANQQQVYILIDEYDHFANRLLSEGYEQLYGSIVEKTGFVRTFFATLKSFTAPGTVARLFMTGVTPLMLDDMSSGFNITTNISMSRRFDTMAGFTHADVERAIDEFVAARPHLEGHLADRANLFETLEAYYDGYRFSPGSTERMFNSDMVLYFLREVDENGQFPEELLDRNVRTAYEHLGRVGLSGSASVAERRTILETILSERTIRSQIVEQFGVKHLSTRAPFISLLYYLGMLTRGVGSSIGVERDLEIPNRVIRELQWEHLAHHLQQEANFAIDTSYLSSALESLGVRGAIAPLLQLFHEQIIQHFAIKDTRKLDERTIKLLFIMFVSLGKVFYALSEKEFSQGYCDLFLAAAPNVPGLQYSWLIEFKYIATNAKETQIEAAFSEAALQVEKYSQDTALLPMLVGNHELRCGMMVFVGTKRLLFRSWPDDVLEKRVEILGKAVKKKATKKKAKTPRQSRLS